MAGEEQTKTGLETQNGPKKKKKKKTAGAPQTGKKKLSKKAMLARKKRLRKKRIRRVVGRIALSLVTFLTVVLGGVYALLSVFFLGPSQTAGDKLTMSLFETSALKFVG